MNFDKPRPEELARVAADRPPQMPSHLEERNRLLREVDVMDEVEVPEFPDRIRLGAERVLTLYAGIFGCSVQ